MKESTIQLQRKTLNFVPGEILTREMLQDLYDYPRNAVENYYSAYSDGIVYGLEWNTISPECHRITPGVLKWKGDIFFLTKEIDVEKAFGDTFENGKRYQLFFVSKGEEPQRVDQGVRHVYTMQLAAVRKEDQDYDEIAQNEYLYACVLNTTANGLKLEFNTSDCLPGICADNSDIDGRYCFPMLLMYQEIIPMLENKENKTMLDYQFLTLLYQRKNLPMKLVTYYIKEYEGSDAIASVDIKKSKEFYERFKKAVEAYKQVVSVEMESKKTDNKKEEKEAMYRESGSL